MYVAYSQDGKTAYFDGKKFRKDQKTGYFLATRPTYNGKRERLHVYVWRKYNGPVPDGFHIHHVDGNKDNNEPENLACVVVSEHTAYHSRKYVSEHPEEAKENMNRARVYASQWHKSEKGREWHRSHAKEVHGNLEPQRYVCEFCGKEYWSLPVGTKRFCSNNCKAASRRRDGKDNEKRKCEICGKEFETNKYSKQRACSRKCGCVLRSRSFREKRWVRASVQPGG